MGGRALNRIPTQQIEARIEVVRQNVLRVVGVIEKSIESATNKVFGRRLMKMGRWRIALFLLLIVAFFAPLLTVASMGYTQYSQLRTWGLDGVNQLLQIKTLLPSTSTTTTTSGTGTSGITDKAKDILNPATLKAIKLHCNAAQLDFQRIHTMLAERQGIVGFADITPYYSKLQAVEELSIVGIEAAGLGSELADVGQDFTNSFATSPFSSDGGPILSAKSFADLQKALADVSTVLTSVQGHLAKVDLNALPISAKERDQLSKFVPEIPKAIKLISSLQPYMPLASWALGVDGQRNYLIQTMDRAELRPSGGFNGSWGILNINGGRISKIDMSDVTFVDYNIHNKAAGQSAPALYSWWPFGNWGLRDANLSGDFPTSAKLSIGTYAKEVGVTPPDGAISFSPLVIEHLLDDKVLGPIAIPCYNVTITSTNLEDELHYFQLAPAGQAEQDRCAPSSLTGTTSLRKRFTSALASALQDKVRSAPQGKLLAIVESLKQSLITKDLEVWVSNTDIEARLAKDHFDAAMLRDPATDSTMVVNANFGVNKGTQYMTTTTTETVNLDSSGGANHHLLIQFDYHPTGNIYGIPTYRDFVRVYTSPNAQFQYGTGFDRYTDPPLCYIGTPPPPPAPPVPGATPTPTPTPDPNHKPGVPITPATKPCQPEDAAACNGFFFPGQSPGGAVEGSSPTQIDKVGAPTALKSDEPNRAMFGGTVVIPSFCKGAIQLDWYIPNIAGDSSHHSLPYTFVEQRQSGNISQTNITIVTPDGKTAIKDTINPQLQDCTWVLGQKPASNCDAPSK